MAWKTYNLDRIAQKLVLDAKEREVDSLGQAYKMRVSVAYGLERFWGEHLRLQSRDADARKAEYWQRTWEQLVEVMAKAGVRIPNDPVIAGNAASVRAMAEKLWNLDIQDQRLAMAVLTQLCDCLVWWTQRYKPR